MVASKSVFLSYASQDAAAAASLGAALRAAGVEVWFDQSELRGGDVWDQSIRQHIRECRIFIPVISRTASARGEGYFRLEWKLAVDRSYLMAPDEPFLVPVAIDDVAPAETRVPDRFHDYQWSRLPGGEATREFVSRVAALASGEHPTAAAASTTAPLASTTSSPVPRSRSGHRRPLVWGAIAGLMVLTVAAAVVRSRHASIAPYSAEDRRMTFAVLPFASAAGDTHAAESAAANTDAWTAALERNTLWAHAADRGAVRKEATRLSGSRNIARALDVHFLVRGTVSRTSTGFSVETSMVDGESERSLGTDTVAVTDPALAPSSQDADDSLGWLIYHALEAEVRRAQERDERDLDVRDLTFRAYVYYGDHKGEKARDGYETAQRRLERALALAPNDYLALSTMARINLCDCLDGWMEDTAKATAIGAAAVDKLTRLDALHPPTHLRLKVLYLQGRWTEMLGVSEQALQKDPDDIDLLSSRVVALLRLGRADEALTLNAAIQRRNIHDFPGYTALVADVEYAARQYAPAASHAEAARAAMSAEDLSNPAVGPVQLTLAASEARLGQAKRALATLDKFWTSVPEARTLTAIRHWMRPSADLYGYEPLFEDLRLAGVPE